LEAYSPFLPWEWIFLARMPGFQDWFEDLQLESWSGWI